MPSVFPEWLSDLPMQQQSVLMLATRGPDGDPKHTTFKRLLRPLRATVLKAAKYGCVLDPGLTGDSFMNTIHFLDEEMWRNVIMEYLDNDADGTVLHSYTHFMHAAEILGNMHPDPLYRDRWSLCYQLFVERLHLNPETPVQMAGRLSDWGRQHWSNPDGE